MNIKEKFSVFLVNFNMENSERKSSRKGSLNQEINEIPSCAENSLLQGCDNHIAEMDKIIVEDLINPVMFVMKYALPFINTVAYNPEARQFVVVKGTVWRKVSESCCRII